MIEGKSITRRLFDFNVRPISALGLGLLAGSTGSVIVALAYSLSRHGYAGGPVFWAGLVVIGAPILILLWQPSLSRVERMGLLIVLGLSLYFVKVLHDPGGFTFFDELLHWRTANDIMESNSLFQENPLLAVSPAFPGLEIVVAGIANLSGASIFATGLIVVAAARVILSLALFLFFCGVGLRERESSIAVAVYAGSPGFVFFNSQFAYESLAIPLAFTVLFLVTLAINWRAPKLVLVLLGLLLLAVVATHHITSYALLAFLMGWCVIALVVKARRHELQTVVLVTAGMGVLVAFWLAVVAGDTLAYLQPIITSRLEELQQVLTGAAGTRAAFESYTGDSPHLVERIITFAAVLVISGGVLAGAWAVLAYRRSSSILLALSVMALVLPLSFGLRLVGTLTELVNRFAHFAFLGVSAMVAVGLAWIVTDSRLARAGSALGVVALSIVILGGVQMGWGPTYRIMPGTYYVSADSQSIESKGLAASAWAYEELGPGNRITTDRMNWLLLGSYGRQESISKSESGELLAPVFFAERMERHHYRLLSEAEVEYLLIDRRLSTSLPVVGIYFEEGEPNSFNHSEPISLQALTKFDALTGVNRIYDNGAIVVYDIRRIVPRP